MNILYVTGNCLTRNTSANISHNAFIQGLLENGCKVDIIMARDSWGELDKGLPVWNKANYYVYSSQSVADKIRFRLRKVSSSQGMAASAVRDNSDNNYQVQTKLKVKIRASGKRLFYMVFKQDPVYPLEKYWLRNAVRFRSKKKYDVVISNSSPAASHRLVIELTRRGSIHYNRWIQIWEDPWFHDLYGNYPQAIEKEEHFLLQQASEIVYVSPLTLMYQKKYYPDCAEKMSIIPLPAMNYEKRAGTCREETSFGYFGDYYSEARNILPFYNAIKKMGYRCYIYGDSDRILEKTDKIDVSGRVTLDKLIQVQNKAHVLVHLCNLRGGQIPGKIYHYSVTDKPILFILDGTEAEKKLLISYFEKYNRYFFCNNTERDICEAIRSIESDNRRSFPGVEDFLPREVVKILLA